MITPTRRDFLRLAASSALAAKAARRAAAANAPAPRRPNIVFILSDDLGYGDLGCYGNTDIQTPSIDRLAREGMPFTQAYAGATVCAPSRCCLMTGLHTGHARVRGNALVPLRPDDRTVAEVLKAAGYRTALVGKWGLGEYGSSGVPTRKGFDEFFGYLNQVHAHNSYPTFLYRNDEKVQLKNVVPKEGPAGQGVATERHEFSNDLFTREALAFVERAKAKPFFLYLAYTIPHANNEAGKTGMEVPDLGAYKDKPWSEQRKAHAAMISRMDGDIGKLLQRLKDLGIDENTLVIFSSDNGPHREGGFDPDEAKSSGPLRGIKRDLYEGGIRVPMIARWPGFVPAGKTSEQVCAFWDVLPTAAELAGAQPPAGIDGISMVPALLGQSQKAHEALYWEFHERGFTQGVRMGDWKAVRLGPAEPIELYDLKSDLGEKTNVAAQNPQVVKRIEQYLASARTDSAEFPIRTAPRKKK